MFLLVLGWLFQADSNKGDCDKPIHCEDLDKNDYETKYKGHLTCIKGCKARIKYTERKNNVKFFSTWNKEGDLHDEGVHIMWITRESEEELN